MTVLEWILENKEWLFSGIGVALFTAIGVVWRRSVRRVPRSPQYLSTRLNSPDIEAGRDINISVTGLRDGPSELELRPEEESALRSVSDLISEMRSDLATLGAAFVREFFVVPNRRIVFGSISKPRFRYYEEDYPNLRGQIDLLEEHGFVTNVTPPGNKAPIYRMTEKLFRQLRKEP